MARASDRGCAPRLGADHASRGLATGSKLPSSQLAECQLVVWPVGAVSIVVAYRVRGRPDRSVAVVSRRHRLANAPACYTRAPR